VRHTHRERHKHCETHTHEWKAYADNPRGHWENKKIYELTEKTLSHSKGSWHEIPNKVVVNKKIGAEIKKCTKNLLDDSTIAAGFKDPRFLVCFDSWLKYLPKNFVIIAIFRDPLKVAESLKKRNQFSYEKSLNLWKIYNQNLLEILEKHGGFLLDFDWSKKKILDEINLISKKLGLSTSIDLSEWYSKDLLKSNKTYQSNYLVPKEIKKLHSSLKKRSSKNRGVKVRKIKYSSKEMSSYIGTLLSQIQFQGNYFGELFKEREKTLNLVSTKLTRLQKQHGERTEWATSLDTQLKQKSKELTSLQKQHNKRSKWATSLDTQLKQKSKELTSLQKQHGERTEWATSLDTQICDQILIYQKVPFLQKDSCLNNNQYL